MLPDAHRAVGVSLDVTTLLEIKQGVPNMTRSMANAPTVLEGYLALSGALGKRCFGTDAPHALRGTCRSHGQLEPIDVQ
jgi:hypothetical protein